MNVYAVYASRKHMPAALRSLLDFLVAEVSRRTGVGYRPVNTNPVGAGLLAMVANDDAAQPDPTTLAHREQARSHKGFISVLNTSALWLATHPPLTYAQSNTQGYSFRGQRHEHQNKKVPRDFHHLRGHARRCMARQPGASSSCATCPVNTPAAISSAAFPTTRPSTPSGDEGVRPRCPDRPSSGRGTPWARFPPGVGTGA